jgi:abortive infection bacteriophage resistance protein
MLTDFASIRRCSGVGVERSASAWRGSAIAESDEAFVAHLCEKYDGEMPIWALAEIVELGQVSRLYSDLQNSTATEIATSYVAPPKGMVSSWLLSLNYVRNVAAHHARLFNRKLVVAPARPASEQVPSGDGLLTAID